MQITGDGRAARRHLRLKLAPGHVPSLSWLAFVQCRLGRPCEAERLAREALRLDPTGPNSTDFASGAGVSMQSAREAHLAALRLEKRTAPVRREEHPVPNAFSRSAPAVLDLHGRIVPPLHPSIGPRRTARQEAPSGRTKLGLMTSPTVGGPR
jgi:hypothetical protein